MQGQMAAFMFAPRNLISRMHKQNKLYNAGRWTIWNQTDKFSSFHIGDRRCVAGKYITLLLFASAIPLRHHALSD